jgi:hypothetical protein
VEIEPTATDLNAVVHSRERFVAVGRHGVTATSEDGWTWRYLGSPGGYQLMDVACNGEQCVAVGGSEYDYGNPGDVGGHPVILHSRDGNGWQESLVMFPDYRQPLMAVEWGNGRWVAAGENGRIVTSDDATTWADPVYVADYRGRLHDLLWTGERWLAVGVGDRGWVLASDDGETWSTVTNSLPDQLVAVAQGGGRIVAVGGAHAMVSESGLSWESHAIWRPDLWSYVELHDVAWTGSEFTAVATTVDPDAPPSAEVLTSRDGIDWSSGSTMPGISLTEVGAVADRQLVLGAGTRMIRECPPQPVGGGANQLVVPAVADLAGILGSWWRTDAVLHNPNDRAVLARVALLPRRGHQQSDPAMVVVLPGQTLDLSAELASLLATGPGTGALLVESEQHLIAASRTFTMTAGGSFGQSVPALRQDQVLEDDDEAVLLQLAGGPAARTNVGLVNLSDSWSRLRIELSRSDGTALGEIEVELPPSSFHQCTNLLRDLSELEVAGATASISSETGSAFIAWVSIVDNRTGDALFRLAEPG